MERERKERARDRIMEVHSSHRHWVVHFSSRSTTSECSCSPDRILASSASLLTNYHGEMKKIKQEIGAEIEAGRQRGCEKQLDLPEFKSKEITIHNNGWRP